MPKNEHAVGLGKLRADSQSATERSELASSAAKAFWDSKTTEERSAIMRARAAKRKKKPP